MKKALEAAIKAGDIQEIRNSLTALVSERKSSVAQLEDITQAIQDTPGLFAEDDGKFYASSPGEMTETLISSLREDLAGNFSLPKLRLLTECSILEHKNPGYFSRRTSEIEENVVYPDETLEITEEITDGRVVTANVRPQLTPKDSGYRENTLKKHSRAVTVMGDKVTLVAWVAIAAGIVTTIVGICTALPLLLGIGIAAIMFGAATGYAAITRFE